MPRFEVECTMSATIVLEADDAEEAEQIVEDGMGNLDHSMFDTIELGDVEIDSSQEVKDDAGG